jgi:hypothetical protein
VFFGYCIFFILLGGKFGLLFRACADKWFLCFTGVFFVYNLFLLVIVLFVPLQACSGPEGSRKLRSPEYITTAQDGGKVVSLTYRPPLPPGNARGTHFC